MADFARASVKYKLEECSDIFWVVKLILPVPSNDTPAIFLAVSNAVAVAALPVVFWFNVPTTKSIVPSASW